MPWPFSKRKPTTRAQFLAAAEQQIKHGVPRQAICNQWLKVDHAMREPDELAAYLEAEKVLFNVMVERNLQGKALEQANNVDAAIRLYEANLQDQFRGSHPYERLRIIYTQRKDYPNAIRACQAFLKLPGQEGSKRSRFKEHLAKLQEKARAG